MWIEISMINWAVENKKSTWHKHYQQTWGGTAWFKDDRPIRTKSTSPLPASNCWWHQSSFPDCLVRTRQAVPRCNLTTEKAADDTTHNLSSLSKGKRQGWKRQTVKKRERETDDDDAKTGRNTDYGGGRGWNGKRQKRWKQVWPLLDINPLHHEEASQRRL